MYASLLVSLTACHHEQVMTRFQPAAAPIAQSADKRVAIVLDRVAPSYRTATDGHSFELDGARDALGAAFVHALTGRVAAVQTAPSGAFDVRVMPELTLDAKGMLAHRCTAALTVIVEDARGFELARERGQAQQGFVVMAEGTAACETAVIAAFNQVAYRALAAIDALPAGQAVR